MTQHTHEMKNEPRYVVGYGWSVDCTCGRIVSLLMGSEWEVRAAFERHVEKMKENADA